MPARLVECPGCYRPMGRDLCDRQGLCGDCRDDLDSGVQLPGIVDVEAFAIGSAPTDGDAW